MKNHEKMMEALLNGETLQYTMEPWITAKLVDGHLDLYGTNSYNNLFLHPQNWEIKQKCIKVNEIEVPAPLTVEPEYGYQYWLTNLKLKNLVESLSWDGGEFDMRLFKRGLCHSSRENALKHAEALLKFGK